MPDSPFTNLEKRDELLYVNFYSPIPDDDVFTVTIEHYFGYLNLSGIDDYQRVEQLGQLLEAISKIVVLRFQHGTTRRTSRRTMVFDRTAF